MKDIKINKYPPAYFRFLKDDSSLNAKDFSDALGIKVSTLNNLINNGVIPKPDWICRNGFGKFCKNREWRAITIKKWFSDYNRKILANIEKM